MDTKQTTFSNAIHPQALRPGDTIAIISPAAPSSAEALAQGIQYIESLGFIPKPMPHVLDKRYYLAGQDEDRLADLHATFADPAVKGILCARGGYGCMRLLSKLNWELIQQNPKVFIGFSDVTSLLLPIRDKAGLITFHGPMLTSNLIEGDAYTQEELWKMVTGNLEFPYSISNLRQTHYHCIRPGSTTGPLVGGNLSLLAGLCGTPYQPNTQEAIVFIEDWHEQYYSIDRQMTQLKLAGFFDNIAGLILCDFVEMADSWENYPLHDFFKDLFGDLRVPVGYGFSIGHADQTATLPIGGFAHFEATSGRLEILSSPVYPA